MNNCGNCSKELKFANTPVFGAGKLASGETICLDCFNQLLKIDNTASSKKITLAELKQRFTNTTISNSRIQVQLENIGISKSSSPAIWGRKEIEELPSIIPEDEEIFELIQGNYNGGQGILVATNKRLLFVDKGIFYGLKIEDFGLAKITSIQYESGFISADIKIMASGNIAKITNVDKNLGKVFCEKVRIKLSEPKQTTSVTVVQQQVDVADQLIKLAGLKDNGILTQAEFDAQKAKLLGI